MQDQPGPSAALGVQEFENTVRARLRDARLKRGLTVRELANLASMGPSMVSRLESGRRRLAVQHVIVLAAALGLSLDHLFRPPDAPSHARSQEAVGVSVDGMRLLPLTRRRHAGAPRALKLIIPGDRTKPSPRAHAGHQWLYVLSGTLRLVLGEDDLHIRAGEAIAFDTAVPHWLGSLHEDVEVLVLLGLQGERAQTRLRPNAQLAARECLS